MATSTENVTGVSMDVNMDTCVVIEATVATGFEQTAKEEVEEKFCTAAKAARGKVIADIKMKDVKKTLELGCVDNLRMVMTSWKDFEFPSDELECMGKLRELVTGVDWNTGLEVWKQVYTFEHSISSFPVSGFKLNEPFLTSREKLPKKQNKEKNKKDKFGKKGRDAWKEKRKNEKQSKGGDGEATKPDLVYIGNEGQFVGGQNSCHVEGQFDDAESEGENRVMEDGKPVKSVSQISASMQVDEVDLADGVTELCLESETLVQKTDQPVQEQAVDSDSPTPSKIDEMAQLPTATDDPTLPLQSTAESSAKEKLQDDVLNPPGEPQSSPNSQPTPVESPEQIDTSPQKPKEKLVPHNPLMPSFRVTCNRAGEGHKFDSMCAAANFGGAVQEYFGWNVNMKKFDIEVILNIEWNEVSVCIGLTKESLHKRNITVFGATTLRPTIAYNMLRLVKIQPGDIVCDPMCGSGSIPIQAARGWSDAYHLAGENYTKAVNRTVENIVALNKELVAENKKPICVDSGYWNVNYLPFRDECVDVFITDLPFGKRMGSRFSNQKLYPDALTEMARVCRRGSGRICLLTQDKKCMIKTIQSLSRYWQRRRTLAINLGGLAAGVYVLTRTNTPVTQYEPPSRNEDRASAFRDMRLTEPGFNVVRHSFNSTNKKVEAEEKPQDSNPVE